MNNTNVSNQKEGVKPLSVLIFLGVFLLLGAAVYQVMSSFVNNIDISAFYLGAQTLSLLLTFLLTLVLTVVGALILESVKGMRTKKEVKKKPNQEGFGVTQTNQG